MNDIIQVNNLQKTFPQAEKELRVLHDISTTFSQGKTYAITGASGSGKSTLLHLLGGLDTPTSGTVCYNDKPITLARKNLGFVFQFHYLINELTVLENIMLTGLIHGEQKEASAQKAEKLLAHVGLADKAESFPFELSGGEQQRISILRAVFHQPHFLLADEPTGNLDSTNASHIVDFLLTCQKQWDMGIILCSHDKAVYERMESVFELCDGGLG